MIRISISPTTIDALAQTLPLGCCRRCWAFGIVLSSAQEVTHNRRWAAHQLFPSTDGFPQYNNRRGCSSPIR